MLTPEEQSIFDTQIPLITSKVKTRFEQATPASHSLIADVVEQMGYKILHYCNIYQIPNSLYPAWAGMCFEFIARTLADKSSIFGTDATTAESLTSISEGDTSVNFGIASTAINRAGGSTSQAVYDELIGDYRKDLNHYRRMRT